MLENLTKRQRQIFDIIKDYQKTHGYSPSVRDLMAASGLASPNGVMCHLNSLEKNGFIRVQLKRQQPEFPQSF